VAAAQHENITVPVIPGRLGAYDVSKAVGKGGYAIVYKATRKSDGKIVAIKRVEIFEMTPKKRERCLQEVDLLKVLTHPNVIQMLDAFIDENQLIIVFEWAPAGDLKRLIKKAAESGRGFEESAIWEYFFQVNTPRLAPHRTC
jgi:NIMA (never in mitosis gene a)-related kinase 1/4/5